MKYIEDFLVELDRLDIIVWAEGDRLRCNAPKGVLTAELRAELAERKVEILQFLQKKAIFKQAIPPRSREEAHSLSFAQQRLWFLAQLEGESATYNMPTALHLTGQLDERALQEALTALIHRHESLRVCFPTVAGEATVRLNEVYNPLTTTDLSEFSEAERQCRMSEWMVNHAHTPFDLSTGPLLSLRLLKLGEHKHILLFNMHHIISDGWSIGVLIRELGQFYNAYAHNQAPQLSALPIQYSDYAAWQRHWLQGNVLEQQLAYWIEQLNGAPELLKLPTDFPRPAVMRYQGRHLQSTLDRELAHEIQHLSRQQGVTVFMTLLAAFNVLLFRYSGQTDLVVGSPIANRTHHQTEGLIGFFVNTLVLRTQINGEHTFSELLKQVRHTALEAYSRQDIPFEYLVEHLNPARSLSHSPLFQVAFALQNTPQETLEFSGLEVSFLEPETMTAKFDLTLSIEEQDGVLMCDWEYDTDLFRPETIARMTEHFQVLLEGILKNSEQSLAQLPLLTDAEQHQLLAWNHTATSTSSGTGYPKDHTIVDLFQAQVENTPDNIAVVSEDRQLSYRELNTKANRLAQYLMTLGVGAETLVGICVERSLEMVIGLLGILKAGGAYVPLDPEYPQQRVQFMLEDADVKVVLSQPHLLERLPVSTTNVVCLESEWEQIATGSGENPVRQSGPENLAYVMYTSGSTGMPKGTLLTHNSLSNYLNWALHEYNPTQGAGVPVQSSLAFDATITSLYLPILSGARVILLPEKQELDGLAEILRDSHRVSFIKITPAHLEVLNQQLENTEYAHSAYALIIGGEALTTGHIQAWLTHAPHVRLINEYGPTESVVGCCIYDAMCQTDLSGNVPIGRPIANTHIYILDTHHNPTPLGIPGELCIAGAGLARGYLNRPELTAEKFIDIELFGTSQRIYKTGDLARWRPDGNLEYLGRLDRQVKLRGFRIELGEIEVALTTHSKVQEAAVIVQEELKDRRLLAYFVPQAYNQSLNSSGTVDRESQIKQVEQWQQIFDENYGQPTSSEIEPKFNPIGWNSSYTRLPISKAEMKEWVNDTVDRILSKSPDRILEIGCGTGMLLFQIAPHCHHYTGTDISSEALRAIEQQKKTWEFGSKVTLFQRAADNFEGIEHGSCDAVILNSVIQYFPSIDYLITVLTNAITAVAPGGFIFIGDVRNLQLLEAFHASVQLYQAHDSLSLVELRQRVQEGMRKEKELLIEPDFFMALKDHLPQITHVLIQLKAGYAQNEMSCFRYDVTLSLGGESALNSQFQWLDWQGEHFTLAKVRQLLLEKQPDIIGLKRIPNARLLAEMNVVEQLVHPEETVEKLRTLISQPNTGMEPEEFRALTHGLPYTSSIHYCGKYRYNVVFQRQDSHGTLPQFEEAGYASKRPWHSYANHPFQDTPASHKLVSQLRDFLKHTLPDYMIPSAFIPLESMPLTPNGKTDRRVLAQLSVSRHQSRGDIVPPQTAKEELLASIWTNVLGLEQVSIFDNFFDLGGHSLLATQLVSRIRETFQMEMPLRVIFNHAILHEQAEWLDQHQCGSGLPPISPLAEGDPLVLSFAQHRLWFLAQLEGQSAAYNMPAALHLTGQLDNTALQDTLTALIHRHDSLRVCFPIVDGEATVQLNEAYNPLHVTDLSELSETERQCRMSEWIANHAHTPFDLNTGPLLRVRLLKLGEHEQILLFNMHHIISDGWSMGVLVREWSQLYSAYAQHEEPTLPPLSIQYTDYAAWQRHWLHGEVLEQQLTYWIEKLSGAPELLELPTDDQRPAVMRYQGKHVRSTLDIDITRGIQQFSRQQDVTVFMTLLAAFQVLLSRYSGQHDIVVGSPIANRTHHQTEDTIGFFVNMLALRMRLNGGHMFSEFLKQVRQTTLEAYSHQDIPFEYLVEHLNPTRSLSHSPVFQVVFVLQNAPQEALELSGVSMSFLEPEQTTAKFDLTLNVAEQGGVLVCDWEYNTDLFRSEMIARMSDHFQILLEGILNDPAQSLAQLPLLTDAEQHQLQAWNHTATSTSSVTGYPKGQTIVDIFQAQVENTPDNIAVVFEDRHLSYQELNTKANQSAQYLMTLGVGADTLVGMCVERSLEMVIGLLGILKAGGAYVPLDPEYPQQRVQFMLEDSEVQVVLSQRHLLERLPASTANVVCLESEWEQIAGCSGENPVRQSGPEHVAYVIYTSGSTGKPKGVMVEHIALDHFTHSAVTTYRISQEDRVLQFASLNFDTAVEEIYPILTQGGRVILRDKGMLDTNQTFLHTCRQMAVTILDLPTAYWQQLITAPDTQHHWPESVRLVIVGGEAASLHHVKQWQQTLSQHVQLLNTYGPTEATVVASSYRLTEFVEHFPIGKPLPHTKIYIVDTNHTPTPPGIPGELCIAGAGLARGYLKRPELTAEKFIEIELFGQKQRLYKTGDVARWLPDGNLEFLGRLDHQVKLRGFRIELGEIESVLSQHEAVQEAVVVLDTQEDHPRLVAYVTAIGKQVPVNSEQVSAITELRAWLTTRLPDYMVPAVFMLLDQLPLTPNGKIDRNALPEIGLAAVTKTFEAPRTDTEQRLLDVWTQVLKQPDIGIFDNFFERGGDSIVSIQIVARTRAAGLELSPHDIFQHQTIAELAQVARSLAPQHVVKQGPITGHVPLTPIQQEFFASHPKEPWHFNQAILLSVPADIDDVALQQALVMLLQHHDALRLRYRHVDDSWQQWHEGGSTEAPPFHIEELSHVSHEAQAHTLRERVDCWQTSLNVETGPLMRLVLFRLGREVRMFWCIHHLVVDGVSWRILLDDLQTAYHQAVAGQPLRLPAKTSAFQAWAEHLVTWKESASFIAQAEYWRTLPEATPFPLDSPTGRNRRVDCRYYTIRFTADATQRLLTDVPAAYHTHINDVLLTALLLTLRDWTGETRHLIDLESHGRADVFADIDLSRTVGWFTAVHTIYLALPDTGDLNDCLQTIRKQLRQIPHNGVGYGVLRYLKGDVLPQGHLLFNYLGQLDQGIQDSLFSVAEESSGQGMSLEGEREHLIEINGHTLQGQLSLTFSYSIEQYESATIQRLADTYQRHLQRVIEHAHHQDQPSPDLSTLLPLQSGGSRVPLFCLPGLGSKAGYFHQLAISLGPEHPVYGLQSPGLDGHTEIPATVEALARHNVNVIRHVQPSGPYQVAGHSFGSAVALETARQLEQQGASVGVLVIFDQPTPQYSDSEKNQEELTEIDWIWAIVEILETLTGLTPPVNLETLKASKNPRYCYQLLVNWLKSHHAHEMLFTAESKPEELRAVVQVYKANSLAFPRYKPAAGRVHCPIDLFCAEETQKIRADDRNLPEYWGWAEHTQASVRIHQVSGAHITMLRTPHVKTLAARLQTLLSSTHARANRR